MVNQETENKKQNDSSEDFGSMLDESMKNLNTSLKKGDVVTGTVSSINEAHIIISLGVKQDAYAEIGDYMENGVVSYKVGDEIKGFVVRMNDDQITIAKSLNRTYGNKILIRDAFKKQIPVKGKIIDSIKGGYQVEVFGIKAFCPYSQIDIIPADKPELYKNNTYDFEIIEYEKGNIILSRKSLLTKQFEENKAEFFSKINEGDTIKGKVVRITNFGAFIDLGGFEGLLHISELSWNHVERIDDVLSVGEEKEVKILKLDSDRISLSIRALQENPFVSVMEKYKIGDMVKCKVLRNENFGSIVVLDEGVEGFIPKAFLSNKHVNKPSDILSVNDEIEARIIRFDDKNNRVSLSLKEDVVDLWDTEGVDLKQGQEHVGMIEHISDHGAFIKIKNGITGLMPISKIKRAKLEINNDSIGTEIEVRIANIDHKSQRLSLEPLSLPALEPRKTERKEGADPKKPKDPNRPNRPSRDYTQDNDWQKYATNYQSVPEDNPFNDL